MLGKFLIGEWSSLYIEDINKHEMICSFHCLLNYGVAGDKNTPDFINPPGAPTIGAGFELNNYILTKIEWDDNKKEYLFYFTK